MIGSSDRKRRFPFRIPHSLAFLPDKRELCVADRDNGRIQCFMAETGEFVKEIKKDAFGGEVFAIAYSPVQGMHAESMINLNFLLLRCHINFKLKLDCSTTGIVCHNALMSHLYNFLQWNTKGEI